MCSKCIFHVFLHPCRFLKTHLSRASRCSSTVSGAEITSKLRHIDESNRRTFMQTHDNNRQVKRIGSGLMSLQRNEWRCCRNKTQGRSRRNTQLEQGFSQKRPDKLFHKVFRRRPLTICPSSYPKGVRKQHSCRKLPENNDHFKNHVFAEPNSRETSRATQLRPFRGTIPFLWSVCRLLFRFLLVPGSCHFQCRACPLRHFLFLTALSARSTTFFKLRLEEEKGALETAAAASGCVS